MRSRKSLNRIIAWMLAVIMLMTTNMGVWADEIAAVPQPAVQEEVEPLTEEETDEKKEAQSVAEEETDETKETQSVTEKETDEKEETQSVTEPVGTNGIQARGLTRSSGTDRTNDFKIDSLDVKLSGYIVDDNDSIVSYNEVVYEYGEQVDSTSIKTYDNLQVTINLAWSQKDAAQEDFVAGDYILFEVCTISGCTPANWDIFSERPLIQGTEQLGTGQLVVEKTGDGKVTLYFKIIFTESIEGKHDIQGKMNAGAKITGLKTGDKIEFSNSYDMDSGFATVEIVDKPSSDKGTLPGMNVGYNLSKSALSYSSADNTIRWRVFVHSKDLIKAGFDAYLAGAYETGGKIGNYDNIIVEEKLDEHQSFYNASGELLDIEFRMPMWLYDSENDGKIYSYGNMSTRILMSLLEEITGGTNEEIEATVRATARSYAVIREPAPGNPSATRERLIMNLGAFGDTGLRYGELMPGTETEYGSLGYWLKQFEKWIAICEKAIEANPEASDNDEITYYDSGLAYTYTMAHWKLWKRLYSENYNYYNIKDASGKLVGPYVCSLEFDFVTRVLTENIDTVLASAVGNSISVTGVLVEFDKEASKENFWSAVISAGVAEKGEIQIFKADSLHGNDAGDKADASSVSGAMGHISFAVYEDGKDEEPLKFKISDSGKYAYSASGSHTSVTTNSTDGSVIISGLSPGKTYYLREISAPDGYYSKQNQRIEFTVDSNKVTYKLVNNYRRGVSLTKVDTVDGKTITTGATFELYEYDADTNTVGKKVTGFTKTTIKDTDYLVYNGTGTDALTTGEDGKLIIVQLEAGTYCLKEVAAPEGYQKSDEIYPFVLTDSMGEDVIYVMEVGNTPFGSKISKTVSKTWNDADNQDGKRPGSVEVQLYADKKPYGESVTLNAGNDWSYTWDELPEKQNGELVSYTVEEVDVPNGYTVSYSGTEEFKITNSHIPETVSVSGRKTWDDADNQDGKRPGSITVNLLADGHLKESKRVSAAENWSYSWTELPKYENGKEIKYTITETPVDDYDTTITGYNITNSYTPGETSRTVVKAWDDADNQDGKRPGSVQAQLYADGKAYGTPVTLNEANEWTHTWNNLPEKQGGVTVTYTVEEVKAPAGYTASYGGTEGFTIINSYTPETVDVSGTKTWDDADDQDGKRPDDITVNLLANGLAIDSKTVSGEDDWNYSWTELPKYEDGAEIEYAVTEDSLSGYQVKIEGYDITNSYTPGETSRTVVKAWDDADNQDGKRQGSVQAQLYADGKAYGTPVTLNEANEWIHTWNNLPEKQGGQTVTYTVEEVNVPADYTASYGGTEGFTIINSYTPETVDVSGTKTWDDTDDQDGKRPDDITVNLLANGLEIDSKTVGGADNWSYSWIELPKYENGAEITYTVIEAPVSDYQTTINGYDIINSYTPGETSRTVVKAWEDNRDYVNTRPDMIQVQLYADGKAYGDAVTLNEASNWIYTWNNLPEMQNKHVIVYTVEELDVPVDYAESYSEDGFVITNTSLGVKDYEVTDVSGTKTWDDDNDQDGKRPDSITVNLYANGALQSSKTVTADDEWKYEWTGLLRYEYGIEIEYTVTENPVTDYSTEIKGYNITNTYTPGETSRTVKKIWDDKKNSDGIRPISIEVQLYADGTAVGDTIELNADNNWKHTWSGLAESKDGETVVYTVKEADVPTGYKVSYSSDTFVITNKHNVTGNKDDDGNDNNGNNNNGGNNKGYNNTTFNKTTSSTINPKTGDYSNIVLWSLLLMAACAAMIFLLYSIRKNRIKK